MATSAYEPTFVFLKQRLGPSQSANILGRVIHQYQDPTFDSTPDSPGEALSPPGPVFADFLLEPQYDYDARVTAQTTTTSSKYLKLLALLSRSSTIAGATTVTSPRITTRRLGKVPAYFAALKSIPHVRRRLLEMCPVNKAVYLVVGTMSAQTAAFHRSASTQHAAGGGVAVPTALAASAAAMAVGVPLPVPGEVLPDVEAGVARVDSAATTAAFRTAPAGEEEEGEEVFAIACKVVKRSFVRLGTDVRVSARRPEFTGAQHFGVDDDDEEEELGEDEAACLAQGLTLEDWVPVARRGEVLVNQEGDVVAG